VPLRDVTWLIKRITWKYNSFSHVWVPVTATWHVHGLRMEETASRMEGSNHGQPTKGSRSALGLGEGPTITHSKNKILLRNVTQGFGIDRLSWTHKCTFGYHESRGISLLAEWILVSQELSSMTLVSYLLSQFIFNVSNWRIQNNKLAIKLLNTNELFSMFLEIKRSMMLETFEFFTAMKIQIEVFWGVTPCSDAVGYRRFGEPCCLHLEGEG
jgi:hypothetical protein